MAGVKPLKGKSSIFNVSKPIIAVNRSGSSGYVAYFNEPVWISSYCFMLDNCVLYIHYSFLYNHLKKDQKKNKIVSKRKCS